MPRKEEPYCENCGKGSDYVIADATAQWDVASQDWELVDASSNYYCSYCDGWTKWIGWREVDAQDT